MVSALFLAVSLCIARVTISNCHKSQEEGKSNTGPLFFFFRL